MAKKTVLKKGVIDDGKSFDFDDGEIKVIDTEMVIDIE